MNYESTYRFLDIKDIKEEIWKDIQEDSQKDIKEDSQKVFSDFNYQYIIFKSICSNNRL